MEDAPWYEQFVIPALLRHARTTYGHAMRAALAEAGYDDIPANGLYIIGALALGEPDAPLRDLIEGLGITKQGAGQLVDTLVMRGYLSRSVDPKDRRQLTVRLTERGRTAAAVQGEARDRIDAELLDRIGADDLRAARRALGTLIEIHKDSEAGLQLTKKKGRRS